MPDLEHIDVCQRTRRHQGIERLCLGIAGQKGAERARSHQQDQRGVVLGGVRHFAGGCDNVDFDSTNRQVRPGLDLGDLGSE